MLIIAENILLINLFKEFVWRKLQCTLSHYHKHHVKGIHFLFNVIHIHHMANILAVFGNSIKVIPIFTIAKNPFFQSSITQTMIIAISYHKNFYFLSFGCGRLWSKCNVWHWVVWYWKNNI